MQGTFDYPELFPTGQYGRFWMDSGSHARGRTFHVVLLPAGVHIDPGHTAWNRNDTVELYGIVSGRAGWTESYGWLHQGPWIQEFNRLVDAQRAQRDSQQLAEARRAADAKIAERQRQEALLATYKEST